MKQCLLVDLSGELQDMVAQSLSGMGQGLHCDVLRQPGAGDVRKRYDVVLLDMRPYVDFNEAFRRVLRDVGQACVIGFVEPREPVDRVLALEMGADAIIVPPFGPQEIGARVRALLRRQAEAEAAMSLPQGRLDCHARTLTLPGQAATTLADSEARLLQLLATRPGQVMSRAEVLARTGLSAQGRRIQMVELMVSRLRQRLRTLGVAESPIRTVRGQGYAWTPSALSLEVVARAAA